MKRVVGLTLTAGLFLTIGIGALAQSYVLSTGGNGKAPVTSVNGGLGDVVVQTVQRQASAPLDASQGTVTWAFPTAFTNPPTCYESLVTTSTGYSFDDPVVTTISTTSVSLKIVAHPTSLTITSLTLPIVLPLSVNPPAGTTVTLTCVGALP